jgi:23S rRNA U2552 (ribose-2'-O)-methylase RlmE/FtsJ
MNDKIPDFLNSFTNKNKKKSLIESNILNDMKKRITESLPYYTKDTRKLNIFNIELDKLDKNYENHLLNQNLLVESVHEVMELDKLQINDTVLKSSKHIKSCIGSSDNPHIKLFTLSTIDTYEKHDIIVDQMSKLYTSYVDLYKDAITLNDLSKIDNDRRFTISNTQDKTKEYEQYFVNEDGTMNNMAMCQAFNERLENFDHCADTTSKDKNKEYFRREKVSEQQIHTKHDECNDDRIIDTCVNIKWGPQDIETDDPLDKSIFDNMFYLETFISPDRLKLLKKGKRLTQNEKQVVLGDREDLKKKGYLTDDYKNKYPQIFRILFMASNWSGSCNKFLEWTKDLNYLMMSCPRDCRFIIPKYKVHPHKYIYQLQNRTNNEYIFNSKLVGILVIDYVDDRSKKKQKKSKLYIFISYNDEEFTDKLNVEKTNLLLYDFDGYRYYRDLVFRAKNSTYSEFNLLACYLKRNVYMATDNQTYFFYMNEMDPSMLILNNLEKISYKCYHTKHTNTKHIIKILKRELSDHDIKIILKNEQYIYSNMRETEYYVSDYKLDDAYIKNNYIKSKVLQSGGSNNLKIKLSISDIPIIYDQMIASNNYHQFVTTHKTYRNKFKKSIFEPSDKEALSKTTYQIYPYLYVTCSEYVKFQTESHIIEKKQRKYLIKNFLNDLNCKSIIKYKPLSNKFYQAYEEIYKNDLIPDTKIKILEISNNPTYLEAIYYYEKKYKKRVSDYDLLNITKYPYSDASGSKFIKDYNSYYTQYLPMRNTFDYDNFINMDIFKVIDTKYDHIYSNLFISYQKVDLLENQNMIIYFFTLTIVLQSLNTDGTFVWSVGKITTKALADIILIGKQFFKETDLYYAKINNDMKHSGTTVIFRGFKGIDNDTMNMLKGVCEQLTDIDPSAGIKFNIRDKEIIEKYNIRTDTNTDFSYKYVTGFLDKNMGDPEYDFIKQYNEKIFGQKNLFLHKLIYLMAQDDSTKHKLTQKYKKEQFIASKLWAVEMELPILEFDKSTFDSDFGKMIIRDMYAYHSYISFKFKYLKESEQTNYIFLPKFINEFETMSRELFLTDYLIDTRDITKWDEIKMKVRYYKPNKSSNLSAYIASNYNTGKISQAWLKMYEILEKFDLLDKSVDKIRTFHICEAPGNFIAATNHYIKTKTNARTYEWNAQSLNPRMSTDKQSSFGDHYGLMRRYPGNWDWGPDMTGDITHVQNIRYYQKHTMDVNLITSDCGLPWRGESDDSLLKVHFAEMVFILTSLPVGANFVAKFVLPVVFPSEISILYICYSAFKELHFYKSVLNQYSKEFYVIGKGFRGITNELKDKLIIAVDNYDKEFDLFKKQGYTEDFMHQLLQIIRVLSDNYIFQIERQLYYVDNYESIDKKHFEIINKYVIEKNDDWIEQFNIQKIQTNDRL